MWTAILGSVALAALITGAVSLYTNNKNVEAQEAANEANIEAQKEVNAENQAFTAGENEASREFQREQAEITRQREDNALQRKVNDAQAAGLSPLAALGSSGSQASLVSAPSALNYAGQVGYVQPATYDASGFISAISSLATDTNQQLLKDKDMDNAEKQRQHELKMQTMQIKSNERLAKNEISKALKIANMQDRTRVLEIQSGIQKVNAELQYKTMQLNAENARLSAQQFAEQAHNIYAESQSLYHKVGYQAPVYYVSSKEKFAEVMRAQTTNYNNACAAAYEYAKNLPPDKLASFWSKSHSEGSSTTDAASANLNFPGIGGGGSKTNAFSQDVSDTTTVNNEYEHDLDFAHFLRMYNVKLVMYNVSYKSDYTAPKVK